MDLPTTEQIRALRGFNRFYTREIGVLEPYLGSTLSLTEVRVLYELAHRDGSTASAVGRDLGLDAAYLSRILKRFEGRGWLRRESSATDARQQGLHLTDDGHAAFAPLQQSARDAAGTLLQRVPGRDRIELLDAMATVQRLLGAATQAVPASPRIAVLRDPRPGDMGWVVQQHGELYAREYGLDSRFEALVAELVAGFVRQFQPTVERCWIAELDGTRVGCVFVVRKSAEVAQLRMLLLLPQARGAGVGAQLVDAAIAFARDKGYRRMVLWTQSNLAAARRIYAARGFVLVHSEPGSDFGPPLVSETWEMALR